MDDKYIYIKNNNNLFTDALPDALPTLLLVDAALALVTQTMLWDAGSMSLQNTIKWLHVTYLH